MVQVLINGQSSYDLYSLEVIQSIDAHHYFKLELNFEEDKAAWNDLMKHGMDIEIKVSDEEYDLPFLFKGIVQSTSLQMHKDYPRLIVTGFSPTILLHDGQQHKSFKDKSPKAIVDKLLNNYANCSVATLNELPNQPVPYAVQYEESSFEYVRRLSAQHQSHLFYDGTQLILGKLNAVESNPFQFIFGEDLSFYNVTLGITPLGATVKGYDYIDNQIETKDFSGKEALNNDPLIQKMIQQAKGTYENSPVYINPFSTKVANLLPIANCNLAGLVKLEGVSYVPGLKLGSIIQLKSAALGEIYPEIEANQKFRIIEVSHFVGNDSSYQNNFLAIPAGVEYIPNQKLATPPPCTSQVAVVKGVEDPKKLGRLTCEFLWDDGKASPWLRVINKASGKNNQLFLLPDINEQLLIGFENNHPEHPFVYGSFFNGEQTAAAWQKDEIGLKFGDLEYRSNRQSKTTKITLGNITIEANHQSGELKIDATTIVLSVMNTLKMKAKALIEIAAQLIKLN